MYVAFALSAFQTRLAYRSQVWATLFGQLVFLFAKAAIWTAVYRGRADVSGISLAEMITYALLANTAVAAWEWEHFLNEVSDSIETGNVAVYLLKPLRYPFFLFAQECGNFAFQLVAVVLPAITIVGLVYGILPPASVLCGFQFAVFWLLSFVLLFLMATMCGIAAFWLMTAFSLEWTLSGILALLSGTFIPLWFFPEGLAAAVKFLPFAYVGYYPLAVYLGKLGPGETWVTLAIGLGWALILLGSVGLLWRKATRRLIVQGG